MNKYSIRSFAFGVFFTVSLIGSYYFYSEKDQDSTAVPDTKEAKRVLKEQGYTLITKTEFEQLEIQLKQSKEQLASAKSDENKTPAINDDKENSLSYDLYIVNGMSISQIAEQLANKKIVDNKEEFEQYLIKNNYHTKVQIGKFTVANKMSYKDIANLITK
ncbi:hypothetical protein [Niallia sp. 03133]|uniref:hypothetical protein n=1 Tax=Niallia sp. 03133 TaxID=3458060 RepID=UPI0040446F96